MGDAVKHAAASWKTTAAGIFGFLGILGPNVQAWLDTDPATVPDWGLVMAAAAACVAACMARDNDVSSEDAGAK